MSLILLLLAGNFHLYQANYLYVLIILVGYFLAAIHYLLPLIPFLILTFFHICVPLNLLQVLQRALFILLGKGLKDLFEFLGGF